MTIRSRVPPAITLDDDLNLQVITLYRAPATATPPNHVRVRIHCANNTLLFDRPLSDYSSLSGAQKTTLGTLCQALFTETLTLESFT